MLRALVLFAVLLPLFTLPALGRMPELNVKAICDSRSADAKIDAVSPFREHRGLRE
jgi:hypothetical protein